MRGLFGLGGFFSGVWFRGFGWGDIFHRLASIAQRLEKLQHQRERSLAIGKVSLGPSEGVFTRLQIHGRNLNKVPERFPVSNR